MNARSLVSAMAILLTTSLGLAAQKTPPAAKDATPARAQDKSTLDPMIAAQSKARSKALKAQKAKEAVHAKLVDINSATKEDLQKLPGITGAYADQIIAHRPYLTKAHLVTHDVLPAGVYESIKKLIVAKQKTAAK